MLMSPCAALCECGGAPHTLSRHCLQNQNARLILGRSGIEGYGIFARQPIFKGEMVVEYTGERVRPVVADVREEQYENMGLGTYFWR